MFLFIIFRKYINLCLFFYCYLKILSYLLFKYLYKYIKIMSYIDFKLCNPANPINLSLT